MSVQYSFAESEVEIPGWVRQIAKFYSEGSTSDAEFSNALEHLIKTGVITSPRISIIDEETKFMNEVTGNENPVVVPSWIQNNAKWFAEGMIGPTEFAQGIEFMIANEIIKSPNIMVEPKTDTTKSLEVSNDSESIDSKTAKLIYEVQKWNELSMWWLLNVKNAELEVLNEASEQAWKKYAENKTPEMMKLATDIQEKEKETEKETKKVLDIYNTVKDLSKDAKELAIILGNHVIDLENDVKDQQKDFDEDPKIENSNDIDDAIGITSKLQKETNDKLKAIIPILFPSVEGDNAGYEEFAKIGDFLAKDEPLTDAEVKTIVLKVIDKSWPGIDALYDIFGFEAAKELLKLFTEDEMREIYEKEYVEFNDEFFPVWLKELEHPAAGPADTPEDEVESIIPELDTSDFGQRMKFSLFNIQIIEGHDMIFDEEENWREIEKLLEELKGLPGLEEYEETPETKLPETPEIPDLSKRSISMSMSQVQFGDSQVCLHHELKFDDNNESFGESIKVKHWSSAKKSLVEKSAVFTKDYGFKTCTPYGIYNEIIIVGFSPDHKYTYVGDGDRLVYDGSPKPSPETPEDDSPKYVIDVRIIDGKAYPSFQFVIYPPNDDCDYEYLRPAVSKYNTAYHIDFDETGITYSGGGCGSFGTVSSTIPDNNYPITEVQAAFLQEKFGFEDFRDRPYVP